MKSREVDLRQGLNRRLDQLNDWTIGLNNMDSSTINVNEDTAKLAS